MKIISGSLLVLWNILFSSSAAALRVPSSSLVYPAVNKDNLVMKSDVRMRGGSTPQELSFVNALDASSFHRNDYSFIVRNMPNILSVLRLIAVPLFAITYLSHYKIYAIGIFVLASITDFLDGYIARKLNLTSDFGAFLDPVADKVCLFINLIPITPSLLTKWYCCISSCSSSPTSFCFYSIYPLNGFSSL